MFNVSKTWDEATKQYLAPEGYVEISCYIPQLNETLVYTKDDLLNFKHEQEGSIVSGSLPKNHIEFSLDNSDGKWDPNSPRGLERYLSERLKITVRYGFDIGGTTEWIPGGVFYLSEWSTSPGGLDATFKARDIFEYMINTPYTGDIDSSLYSLVRSALSEATLPQDVDVVIGDDLNDYIVSLPDYDGSSTVAEIIQKCANAAGCVVYQDRRGVLRIEKIDYSNTGYVVPSTFAYSYPKVELSRPLKEVAVRYGEEGIAICPCGIEGETQTVDNDFIQDVSQASIIGDWVASNLKGRKNISGEFRGDPRLDLFDVVDVENKYGTVAGVVLTDITCRFGGAFHVTYSGVVRGAGSNAIYCGEVFTGEVS